MGTLTYVGVDYPFDDRTLAHLKVAITAKLRRGESFLLSWTAPAEEGSGRVSLWMSPSLPLIYRFTDPDAIELSRTWLEALAASAQQVQGMTVMDEAEAGALRRRPPVPAARH